MDAFEALAIEVALAEPLVLDSPKPRARLRSFGDSALRYELLCWVNGPTRRRRAQHELNRALYVALSAADIEIPYPKRDVTVREVGGAAPGVASARTEPPSAGADPLDADDAVDDDAVDGDAVGGTVGNDTVGSDTVGVDPGGGAS